MPQVIYTSTIEERLEDVLNIVSDLELWSRICRTILPESFADNGAPEPTTALPRSEGRLADLIARHEAGRQLTSASDAGLQDHEAHVGKVSANGRLLPGQVDGRGIATYEGVELVKDLRKEKIGTKQRASRTDEQRGRRVRLHLPQGE
jgi:hypothetical protein